jgi:hypothetical protein
MAYSGEGFLMFAQDVTGKAVPVAAAAALGAGAGLQTAALSISTPFNAGLDTYTAIGNGVTQAALSGVKSYSIQVKGTGGTPTAWNVVLEGGLNGIDFTTILTHNTASGNARTVASTATLFPSLFFRSRVQALTLGPATNIVVQILGMD